MVKLYFDTMIIDIEFQPQFRKCSTPKSALLSPILVFEREDASLLGAGGICEGGAPNPSFPNGTFMVTS